MVLLRRPEKNSPEWEWTEPEPELDLDTDIASFNPEKRTDAITRSVLAVL
jgi:hypothetical protein